MAGSRIAYNLKEKISEDELKASLEDTMARIIDMQLARIELEKKEDLVSPGISACLGCCAELALRVALKILGKNTILAIPPGCLGGVGVVGYGATTGAKVPVFFPLLDNTAAMLSGIKRHYKIVKRNVNVFAFAGDGGTADVGFQCLSGAAERNENIIYLCYDNEGYMNTGFQRSGTTPYKAWTTTTPVGKKMRGKEQRNKDIPVILAMHDIPYVATVCTAYMKDYIEKLKKAMRVRDGLAYLHLLCPCPTGWGFETNQTNEVATMAVMTNYFPLWESENGKLRITREIKHPLLIGEYTRLLGKFSHLNRTELEEMQKIANIRYARVKALSTMQ